MPVPPLSLMFSIVAIGCDADRFCGVTGLFVKYPLHLTLSGGSQGSTNTITLIGKGQVTENLLILIYIINT